MTYHLVSGLEIHAELKTKSKMFCGCKNDPFGAKAPNTQTCPVCLGLPGALPVANAKAIEWTIKLGLFLGCKINLHSKFDRKNYFYPDLAKSYQISQYDLPFCYDGLVETSYGPVRITRIHLEEDTAKLLHQVVDDRKVTLIDFNRSSVPLIEIVSEPDLTCSAQAIEYAKKIREAIRFLGIGDADMEKGGMRLEANISLQTDEQKKQGDLPNYKVEVKNINSFNFMGQAIDYEMIRQKELLEANKIIPQETRGWNSIKNCTFSQRLKENAADYRYFPDPDLPEISFTSEQIEQWRQELPALSGDILENWQKIFNLSPKYAQIFLETQDAINWAQNLWQIALEQQIEVEKLANFLVNKKITYYIGENATHILDRYQQLVQVDDLDEHELSNIVRQVLAQHPTELQRFISGETKLQGFFIGQIMKTAGKKINVKAVNEIFRSLAQ